MRLTARILRLFFRNHERERMEFRHAQHRAQATAEDLCRTTITHAEQIRRAIEQEQRRES
jgi:hypothetical protein